MPALLAFTEASTMALAQGVWPAALALFLSVSTSILLFPFFPYVPSSGGFGNALPQVGQDLTAAQAWLCFAWRCYACLSGHNH